MMIPLLCMATRIIRTEKSINAIQKLTHENKKPEENVNEKPIEKLNCKLCGFATGMQDILTCHIRDVHAKRIDIHCQKAKDNLKEMVEESKEENALIGSRVQKVEYYELEYLVTVYIIENLTFIKAGIACLSNGRQVMAVRCSARPCQGMAEVDMETMRVLKFPSAHSCELAHTEVEVFISDEVHTSL